MLPAACSTGRLRKDGGLSDVVAEARSDLTTYRSDPTTYWSDPTSHKVFSTRVCAFLPAGGQDIYRALGDCDRDHIYLSLIHPLVTTTPEPLHFTPYIDITSHKRGMSEQFLIRGVVYQLGYEEWQNPSTAILRYDPSMPSATAHPPPPLPSDTEPPFLRHRSAPSRGSLSPRNDCHGQVCAQHV
ncbi:unnamed protein product [Zymoseptoria tritici ST99CH_1A5]|uniref:Uncharacterized protein n=1 Tax=Zymoseptoria tritici ST99CH_1A5 TaxID=1276529 RepID=A0A1Y6M0J2_ZYMTR|nr:unnamed protein product [Zymoseptoria tritici ST99CH_1A5]